MHGGNEMICNASCLCKAVQFSVDLENLNTAFCHCDDCKKQTSGANNVIVFEGEIIFKGQENIKTYDSSAWAERAFCSQCGSNLYSKSKFGSSYSISVGLFQNHYEFTPNMQYFYDKKFGYMDFVKPTEQMSRQQCFDKWG